MLCFVVCLVRCVVFVFRRDVQKLNPEVSTSIHVIDLSRNLMTIFPNIFLHFVQIVQHIMLDMPSLAFFTTYALLVLFWAEIYYQVGQFFLELDLLQVSNPRWRLIYFLQYWQARAVSTDGLRPSFYTINGIVYVIQVNNLSHFCSVSWRTRFVALYVEFIASVIFYFESYF